MIRSAAAPTLSLVVLIWWNRIHACCDDVAVSSSSSSHLEKASPLVSLGNLMPLGTLAFDVVPLVTPLSPEPSRPSRLYYVFPPLFGMFLCKKVR